MNLTFSIVGDSAALSAIETLFDIARAPFGGTRGTRALAAIRALIAEEFARAAERTDAGFAPWPKSKQFGTRQPSNPTLGGAVGRFARAWAGGPGGFNTVGPFQITLGSRVPGAAMHRGDLGPHTIIRPRRYSKGVPLMYWALGRKFGVWISTKVLQRGLKIPARGHALPTREMGKAIADAVVGKP